MWHLTSDFRHYKPADEIVQPPAPAPLEPRHSARRLYAAGDFWGGELGGLLLALTGATLIASVLVAVFHAEIIAHRLGEPFGTLVLAMAVTIIEVSLIVSMMLSNGLGVDALARDTVFATVMIICNGVIGICLLTGAIRHHTIAFSVDGSSSALSVLVALTVLTLVLPEFTTTTLGPT